MIHTYKRNLLIALTLFSLFVILFVSFIDVTRMNNQLKKDYNDKIELAEMNVMNSLRNLDETYFKLDQKLANQMKTNSTYIADLYNKDPDFSTWDFEELSNHFGMDIYIINKDHQVLFSSFPKDVGLDFDECCGSFAKFLDERRKTGNFIHDGIDLQQNTGKLIKYSYMPTEDKKYLIELSFDLTKNPEFQQFDFILMMNRLKEKYTFIQSVSIHNEDYYDFYKPSMDKYKTETDELNTFEWFKSNTEDRNSNYAFIPYQNEFKLVKITFDHTELDTAIHNNWLTFFIQLIVMFIVAVAVMLTVVKMLEKPMYLAFHDRLTGVKNRAAFENEFSRLFEKESSFGILLIDFDHFKSVNDSLGHDQGDLFLKFVSLYIQNFLPENAFLARLGGDEFVILLRNIRQKQALQKVADSLIIAFNDQIIVPQIDPKLFEKGIQIMQKKNVTISIGGAIYPDDGADLEWLYKNVDTALYYSKEHGKNRYTYYGEIQK